MSFANLKGQRTRLKKKVDEGVAMSKALLAQGIPEAGLEETREEIQGQLETLLEYRTRYEDLSERIVTVMGDRSDEELENEGDVSIETVLQISQAINKLSCRLKTVEDRFARAAPLSGGTDLVQGQLQKLIELETARQSRVSTGGSSVKLPKLDFDQFSGDILKWGEFWDSFAASVDLNSSLQPVEKLAYLRAKLKDEAKAVVAGLETTNDNYDVAIGLLRQRFGDSQAAVTAHYSKIMDLPSPPNHTEKIRSMFDTLEQHLRCLASLGEDVDHRHFISLIMTKLPKAVIVKLEEMKGPDDPWSVELLRNKLRCHLVAREAADRQGPSSFRGPQLVSPPEGEVSGIGRMNRGFSMNSVQRSQRDSQRSNGTRWNGERVTAEALFVEDKTQSRDKNPRCVFCKGSHWSDECRKFSTVSSRRKQLHGRCFNCFSQQHSLKNCSSNRACWYCKKQRSHHRSLCTDKFPVGTESTHVASEEVSSSNQNKTLLASGESALLQTAVAEAVISGSRRTVGLRILFDSGSHRTYITEEVVKKLNLKPDRTEIISVNTFAAKKSKNVETKVVSFSLKLQGGGSVDLCGNVVPQIAGRFERRPLNLSRYKSLLGGLKLADPPPSRTEDTSIDVLIGSDYYLDLLTFEKIPVDVGLYLLGSKFGWILSGRLPEDRNSPDMSMLILNVVNQSVPGLAQFSEPDKSFNLPLNTEDYWKLETIGIKDPSSDTCDDQALVKFNESVRFEDGRYFVSWPWREEVSCLPSNFELALGRLRSLIRRFSGNKDLLEKYNDVIQDQVAKGVVEKVESSYSCSSLKHYIPHHAVITPRKTTTKIRIVYDASAKTRKDAKSLNECLLRGPVILENLCGLLMRFRLHKVGLVADVEKAFLQVGLQVPDRDVTRFLWLKDASTPHVEDNLQIYRFCRVPFGVISSPFLLAATILFHLNKRNSPVAKAISQNMYVDNMITGVSSFEEACKFYKDAKTIFSAASMNLREWTSNSAEFLKSVPEKDRTEGILIKVLGMFWNVSSDVIVIADVDVDASPVATKRDMFKLIASFFDPLGFFSPILIRGKILLQELWKEKFDWDDLLPETYLIPWKQLCADLKRTSKISVPRYIGILSTTVEVEYSLYCFCDASAKAYAAAIYLGVDDGASERKRTLIFAKSRLAPTNRQTIPRLELMAVLIGVRGLKFVETELRLKKVKKYLWSDSQCVLHWIGSSKSMGVFVDNRLKEIRSHEDVSFHYVETKENPADTPSRGISVDELTSSDLWWHGPALLDLPVSKWKIWKREDDVSLGLVGPPVLFEASLVAGDVDAGNDLPFGIDYSRFSSLSRLLRVTAWCSRVVSRARKSLKNSSLVLDGNELRRARILWERKIQRLHFSDVFDAISNGTRNVLRHQLDLFVDEDGLLRCGGRLRNLDLPDEVKFPKLLPKDDVFTNLLINDIHNRLFHAGSSHTLAKLRYEYWLPQGRRQVRKILLKCGVCRRWEGGPYKLPRMPDFPKSRVARSVPFTYTGIDYFGPLYVKTGTARQKVWVCLFTCLAVRAIHLELVEDLSAKQFLLCFRRFVARRGSPMQLYSDNASTFKAASSVIDVAWKDIQADPDVQTYFSSAGVKWNFIIQLAPWMFGFYERLIGIVKRSLRKTLGRLCLTMSQLQTILTETEAVVNSRPLTYVADDFPSGFSISPSHFLSLNVDTGCPSDAKSETDRIPDPDFVPHVLPHDFLLESWKKGNRYLDEFWKIWERDYLLSLRERFQTVMKQPRSRSSFPPSVGDVVLIKDEMMPRGTWKTARVTELIDSGDGFVRGARLMLPSRTELIRPIALLYPFECPTSGDVKFSWVDLGGTAPGGSDRSTDPQTPGGAVKTMGIGNGGGSTGVNEVVNGGGGENVGKEPILSKDGLPTVEVGVFQRHPRQAARAARERIRRWLLGSETVDP